MIEQALTLPCGHTIPNRLCKSAMTEGLADSVGRPTAALERLYGTWASGGAGLLITGNIMVDARYQERAGNVVIDQLEVGRELQSWARVVHQHGSQLWAQLNHPGRQCPRLVNLRPLAPSEVQLDISGNFGKPRAATDEDIRDVITRFARAAEVVKAAGFDGVQVHAAHGYLLSQFLSQRTNQRTDQWGGSLVNRARLLIAVVRAVRRGVGPSYPVSVKINSADFVAGGFTLDECLQVVAWLHDESVDLIEVSGGTYEQAEFFKNTPDNEVRGTTREREAMFLKYAHAIKAAARAPIMVTGGFRTLAGMENALQTGDTDMIGVARPFCTHPNFPLQMMRGSLSSLPVPEDKLVLGRGWVGPNSKWTAIRGYNNLAQVSWYYRQIECLSEGLSVPHVISPLTALVSHLRRDVWRSLRLRMARR